MVIQAKRLGQKCPFSCINKYNHKQSSMNNYYTYAYLREDGTPYYIGRGKHQKKSKYRRMNTKFGHSVSVPNEKRRIILKDNLSLNDANKHEIYMIFIFGKKYDGTGILRNLADGGTGGTVPGRKLSEETKRKMSEAQKGKIISDEVRRKISKTKKGCFGTFTGKNHTKETKEKLSEMFKGKPFRGSHNNHKETKWWNNGQINKRSVECPGKEWNQGRLTLPQYNRKNKNVQ